MYKKQFCIVVIMIVFGFSGIKSQKPFDEKNAFVSMLKYAGMESGLFMNEYLFRFENDSYRNYANDEFEVRKLAKELEKNISKTSKSIEFFVEYKSEFGEYNFESNKFSFLPFTESTEIKVMDYLLASRFETNTQVILKFNNATEISGLPMDFDKANFLVKMRKNNKTGKVDRSVYLKIAFKLDGNFEVIEATNKRKSTILFANITTIQVYDDMEFSKNLLGEIETEYLILEKAKGKLSEKK